MSKPKIIPLTEYQAARFAPPEIPPEAGEILLRHYAPQVEVEFPTPKTNGQWQLRALGWVGYLPVTPQVHLALQPKVPLDNIFRMLEVAYRLDFKILEGLAGCHSLADFYERLAHILARRTLNRGRQGFYRAYLPQTEQLPYVRGRIDVARAVRQPARSNLTCHTQEHTVDLADNQILAWALWRIARSGNCTERVLPAVRRAYRSLHGLVTLTPHPPQACVNRLYHRLNADYQPLHALCRFFLEQTGPTHQVGQQTMLPFLVNMARLFELFVAQWLQMHLPPDFILKAQERVNISQTNGLHFEIDLALYQTGNADPRFILDTKYKTPDSPANDDIYQVVAYAEAKGCRKAILIYPTPLTRPLDETIGQIHVRSLAFSLDQNLNRAGWDFLDTLLT